MAVTSFIYLASQSPRRSQLLAQLGVKHELLLPDVDEDTETLETPFQNEAPATYVERVTLLKLHAAGLRMQRRGLPSACILCADTTVALGRTIYGKPTSSKDAARMLGELSGQTHRVLTAVAVGNQISSASVLSRSRVTFAEMTRQQIHAYVKTQEPMGKAGAYAVQGKAAAFISKISGSYSGIMGLPLFETSELLKMFQAK